MSDLRKQLDDAINSGGFGSGGKVLQKLNERRDRENHIPKPEKMNELSSVNDLGNLVCSFGCDTEENKDYQIYCDGYAAVGDDSTAGEDARAFVALWNAYRDGDLVWKEPEL